MWYLSDTYELATEYFTHSKYSKKISFSRHNFVDYCQGNPVSHSTGPKYFREILEKYKCKN